MRYRRSPTCSYCRAVGHSRRSCPTMQARAKEAAAKPENERSWTEQRAVEATSTYKSAAADRSCAYCGGSGHNARGCITRKNDIVVATYNVIAYRKKLLAALKNNGIGIGAILSYDGYVSGFGYSDAGKPHYVIVQGFDSINMTPWNYNTHSRSTSLINCKHLSDLDNSRAGYGVCVVPPISVLCELAGDDTLVSYSSTKASVESAAPSVGIDEKPFISYELCEALVKARFDVKGRRNKPASRNDLIYDKVLPEKY